MNITHGLRRALQVNPNGLATVFGDRRRNWREIGQRVPRLAGGLRSLGISPGDRVGRPSGGKIRTSGRNAFSSAPSAMSMDSHPSAAIYFFSVSRRSWVLLSIPICTIGSAVERSAILGNAPSNISTVIGFEGSNCTPLVSK